MPRFLAVYTMKSDDLARFRALPKAEQKAVDDVGLKHWADWEKANAASFPDAGGMVGKTKRVNKDGMLSLPIASSWGDRASVLCGLHRVVGSELPEFTVWAPPQG